MKDRQTKDKLQLNIQQLNAGGKMEKENYPEEIKLE